MKDIFVIVLVVLLIVNGALAYATDGLVAKISAFVAGCIAIMLFDTITR